MGYLREGISLWPDQEKAVRFGIEKNSVGLSMPMGTGKTITCTALIGCYKPNTVLIVATKNVSEDPTIWPRHLKWFLADPYEVIVLSGENRTDKAGLYSNRNEKKTAYLVNYESVWRNPLAAKLLRNPPDLLITDESHHIKTPSSAVSRFLFKLSRKCTRRIACTGTFLTHTPLDAWAQSRILDPNVLGSSFYMYKNRYAKLGGYMGKEILSGKKGEPWLNQDELARKLGKLWFTCEKPILPFETNEIVRKYNLSDEARYVYERLERDFALTLGESTVSAPLAITRLVRALQACSGFTKTDALPDGEGGELVSLDNGRQELLKDTIQSIDVDERIVVFVGNFTYDLKQVEDVTKGLRRPYFEISGKSSQLAEWRDTPGGVLGVHVKSGAEGLDMTMAKYGVFYTHQHSLGVHEQAKARLVRPPGVGAPITDTRTFVHLVSNQTVEEDVLIGLQHHKDVIQYLYDKMKSDT